MTTIPATPELLLEADAAHHHRVLEVVCGLCGANARPVVIVSPNVWPVEALEAVLPAGWTGEPHRANAPVCGACRQESADG